MALSHESQGDIQTTFSPAPGPIFSLSARHGAVIAPQRSSRPGAKCTHHEHVSLPAHRYSLGASPSTTLLGHYPDLPSSQHRSIRHCRCCTERPARAQRSSARTFLPIRLNAPTTTTSSFPVQGFTNPRPQPPLSRQRHDIAHASKLRQPSRATLLIPFLSTVIPI